MSGHADDAPTVNAVIRPGRPATRTPEAVQKLRVRVRRAAWPGV